MLARVGVMALLMAIFPARFSIQAQSARDPAPHFIISGTSTVRAWSCPAQGVTKVIAGKSSQPVPGFPHGVQTVEVRIPVKAIACEDAMMVEHLRDALNEKTYPEIVYQMTEYTLTGADTAQANGKLTITGVTKPIRLDVKLSPSSNGVRSVGETSIDLTQFSIVPPVIWQGLLKVGKDVRIRFDALLPPSERAGGFHE
ncbi:MAG: YceI family protein [Acidobacteria bacterium]|nr:YceI family protein [Acidobacteriota bacterium]